MEATPQTKRNLRALLALGFFFSIATGAGGAFILALGYSRPEFTQPMWKFGQMAMFMGIINLAIYGGILFKVRRLPREASGGKP